MFFINPFIYAGGGDFESIATVTVTASGGASTIEFTSISASYQHLQIRGVWRLTGTSASGGYANVRLNSDSGSNYAWHTLRGDGSAAAASGGGSTAEAYIERIPTSSQTASVFGGAVLDVLDYASTSKNKTLRSLAGYDANGAGYVFLNSGLWASASAVTSIAFTPSHGNFAQHSTVALFGVKAP